MTLSCFKAYDIRGKLGNELNEDIAYRIGRAYAQYLNAKRVVLGGDVRLTSESLKQALANGLMDGGADVIDIGMTGTEEVYFAAFHLDVDGGIEVTASHNPMDYNGMKLVRQGARPISGDTGLKDIQALAEANQFPPVVQRGELAKQSILAAYVDHLLTYIDLTTIKPLKLVVNAGNGAAGHVIDAIEAKFQQQNVPVTFIKVHHQPDGSFPNGIPNPLLPDNRAATADAVKFNKADMGIAWDGDFDRCFLFDENGEFIEGYYIVGLLAAAFLAKHPGEKVIHDPRLTWNTIDIVTQAGGVPILCKTGHAFIKERMRSENAIYGGEMSAHHYFRDFAYCDSGMIPWLLVAELISRTGKLMSELVGERIQAYPCSGEINYQVADAQAAMERVREYYSTQQPKIDTTDGLSMEFETWRLNLRSSNTEPLLRLNIETKADNSAVWHHLSELEKLIKNSTSFKAEKTMNTLLGNTSEKNGKLFAHEIIARIKGMNREFIARIKGINWLFLLTVVVPTLLSIIYFGLIASDVYISESRFLVRSPERQTASPLGAFLKGTGFSSSQGDTYTVQDFMLSRDALHSLNEKLGIGKAFASNDVDMFSRFAGLGWDNSFEALHLYYQKKIDIQLDAASSITTLTVRSFTAEDAFRINQQLLEMGEALINQLNDLGRQDMIHFATGEVRNVEKKVKAAALALATYRNQKGVIDPESQSSIQLQQIAKLQDQLIATEGQLTQLQTFTKENPQIPSMQKRVQTLRQEIDAETAQVAGGNRSLANKAAEYQRLALDREFANTQLGSALASLEQARNEAQRKQLYLERVVQPSKPDMAMEPRRIRGVISTLVLGLVAWGILTLLIAGVKEHQD